MKDLLWRLGATWFNDGKRLTALFVSGLAMLLPKIRALGVPVPEGAEQSLAPFLASWILILLSKADARIPTPPPT